MTLANFMACRLESLTVPPTSLAKAERAPSATSAAMICFGPAISDTTKPLASAVAILPAPRNPIFHVDAIGGVVAIADVSRKAFQDGGLARRCLNRSDGLGALGQPRIFPMNMPR